MKNDSVQKVNAPEDLDKLKKITQRILYEICWRATLTYGDELSLHIGARIPYSQKSMAHREKGAWILGTRATAWNLDSQGETIITDENDPDTIKEKVRIVEGTMITAFEASYPHLDLTVKFSNGCTLFVLPNFADEDLAYWELFTPDRMVLRAGPRNVWSYVSSTVANTEN